MNEISERHAIALTLYGEARGESMLGKLAVAAVLRNRLYAGRWGTTYAAVCLASKQFSCWNAKDPNLPKLQRLHAALTKWTLQEDASDDAALQACLWVADGLLGGFLESTVGAATHYYATSMKQPPSWAVGARLAAEIGNHRFFEGVR